eukprot:Protomagalhaensia_wolfi_Nauph_80__519@NODE_1294_length_1607_cov_9_908801_g1000_i0_p2_GENE_NODE_1294_length_1607_cov_9_908801_g1000_i0NODE_1294_length_1607_cov_9_908801_g1000_i0_p2_ORF_typecomplete_len112_score1_96RVP/PF00077_20/6e02RVP/PF00077_20/0_01gagasp_proteas/PF13975_6/3_6e03gagasp_proteas/PF13975_6/0_1_NODE_1294_length_1607_cov_9_908801_g1000_i07641099
MLYAINLLARARRSNAAYIQAQIIPTLTADYRNPAGNKHWATNPISNSLMRSNRSLPQHHRYHRMQPFVFANLTPKVILKLNGSQTCALIDTGAAMAATNWSTTFRSSHTR